MKKYDSVQSLLDDHYGQPIKILKETPVTGGAINDAFLLSLDNGEEAFLKTNTIELYHMFECEWNGVKAIEDTHTIQVPELFGIGIDQERNKSFILMEYIHQEPNEDYYRVFGQELAKLHLADTKKYTASKTYGFLEDNYIGRIPQKNTLEDSWINFYRECRLRPQFEMAESYFTEEDKESAERLLERLEEYLIEPEFPSLLHGDLWEGNSIVGKDGKAWLVDPGCYVGHNETDLAMMELYGGFSPELFKAYYEVIPQVEGYPVRRDLYQLYHVVNHLNLFGERFLPETRMLIHKYGD